MNVTGDYIFNLDELSEVYETYLHPYLGDVAEFLDPEDLIMGELFCALKYTDEKINSLSRMLIYDDNTIVVGSDIKQKFFDEFNQVMNKKIGMIYDLLASQGATEIEMILDEGFFIKVDIIK